MSLTYTATRRACYVAYITQGIVNNLAPVLFIVFQAQFNLSYQKLGSLILINFTAQLITDVLAVRFIDGLGYRLPIIAAHAFSAAGFILLGVLPGIMPDPYIGLVIAIILSGIGGGLLEVLVSPIVDSLPTPAHQKASAMSMLHSFYCWGQVLVVLATTLMLYMAGGSKWRMIPVIWAIVPLINMFFFSKVPIAGTLPQEQRVKLRILLKNPAFIALLVLMLCSGSSELTISQWSSLFAERGLGLSKLWGDIAGPCMFALLMGIGRTVYGVWGGKFKPVQVMAGSATLCVCCYLLAALSRNPVFSLIGCAISGFSVSIMWPGTFSLSAARFPLGGAAMFGILAMAGDIGCSLGPWMAGIIADKTGGNLNSGILSGTLFPLIMLVILLFHKPEPSRA